MPVSSFISNASSTFSSHQSPSLSPDDNSRRCSLYQLGYSGAGDQRIEKPIESIADIDFNQISCGGFHSLALSGPFTGLRTDLMDDLKKYDNTYATNTLCE